MPRTNLNDILIFMAVVDAGSFIAGGQAMGLSRSAAGKAVIRLEDRLGARLLNRTTRTLSLTDEGRVFYERGLQILAAVDEAEASLGGQSGMPRGLLRLTVPDAFGRLVVMPLLEKYLRAWPDIQVEVSFTDHLSDIIEDGFDLAIRIGAAASDTRLVSRVIATYKTRLCASPSYLAANGEPRETGAGPWRTRPQHRRRALPQRRTHTIGRPATDLCPRCDHVQAGHVFAVGDR